MKIAVSTISYVNELKPPSEIYTTFAKRLAKDVMEKTPFDFIVNTNRRDLFAELEGNSRILIRDHLLKDHKTSVGPFNQMLKFTAIKEIDSKYDWVIYFDCDAGLRGPLDVAKIEEYLNGIEAEGYEMSAMRTNATYEYSLKEFRETTDFTYQAHPKPLFNDKFSFYGVNESLIGSVFPSEHVFVVKNNDKLKVMADEFEKLCYQFETQTPPDIITSDMEAYEIGVSAFLAKIKIAEMGHYNHGYLFNIEFNGNNLEKVKI